MGKDAATNDVFVYQGKRYISVKRAASITGYAKDYVGQLCRAGKINARLIGRNWYVLEEALLNHKTVARRKRFQPGATPTTSKIHVKHSSARLEFQRQLADAIQVGSDAFESEAETYDGPLIPEPKKIFRPAGTEVDLREQGESEERPIWHHPQPGRGEKIPKILDLRKEHEIKRALERAPIRKAPRVVSTKEISARLMTQEREVIENFSKKSLLEYFLALAALILMGVLAGSFALLFLSIEFL